MPAKQNFRGVGTKAPNSFRGRIESVFSAIAKRMTQCSQSRKRALRQRVCPGSFAGQWMPKLSIHLFGASSQILTTRRLFRKPTGEVSKTLVVTRACSKKWEPPLPIPPSQATG